MVQDVYIDLLFLINFSMDYLCIFICSKILHRRMRPFRMILAASLGGIYSVVSLFLPLSPWAELAADCAVGFLICTVVYAEKERGSSSLFLASFLFMGVSLMSGGCMTAIFNLLNKLKLPLDSVGSDGISTYVFALIAAAAGVISLKSGQAISKHASVKECRLHINFCGKELSFMGFADSGNLVRDPISGRAVIFLDRAVMEKEISLDFLDSFAKGQFKANSPCKELRLISLRTASGSSLAVAAMPESIRAEFDDKKGKTTSFSLDALISPADIGKSANGYTAIIPSEILKR